MRIDKCVVCPVNRWDKVWVAVIFEDGDVEWFAIDGVAFEERRWREVVVANPDHDFIEEVLVIGNVRGEPHLK